MADVARFPAAAEVAAQQTYRGMPRDIVDVGLTVRAAFALPDDVCTIMLPAASLMDGAVWRQADEPTRPTSVATQAAAIEALIAFEGRDATTAAMWLLAATGRYSTCPVKAEALSFFHAVYVPHRRNPRRYREYSPSSLAAGYADLVAVTDPAGVELAHVLTGARSRSHNLVLAAKPTMTHPSSFAVLHAFSGNRDMWRLFVDSAGSSKFRRFATRVGHLRSVTVAELEDAVTLAAGFDASTVAIAATLVADNPGARTMADALDIASLVRAA